MVFRPAGRILAVVFTVAALLVAVAAPMSASELNPVNSDFTFFAWRSLGYHSNGAPHVKMKCFLGADGDVSTGETGQAEQGWHELHPRPGPQTATFEERGDAVPTFAGPVQAAHEPEKWAVFDVPIYWPYEADNLVWGQQFTDMGQTFVAEGSGLYTVSVRQQTWVSDLYAEVREGGPLGNRVGPAARLVDGPPGDGSRAGWLVARWNPGEMPLEKGKTYYLGVRSQTGKPFALHMHSTGDVYRGGRAYFDGKPEPSSDLGILLGFERDDAIQSQVLNATRDNWVRGVKGVYFMARSANIRGIFADVWFPGTPFHVDVLFKVYKVGPGGKLEQVGSEKSGYNYTKPGTAHHVAAVYGADMMPLEVGQKYYLEIVPRDAELPTDPAKLPAMDLSVRIWGEKTPGMNPVIYRQHVKEATESHVTLAWEGSPEVETTILYGEDPYNLDRKLVVPAGQSEAAIGPFAPGTTVSLRLRKTSPIVGGKFDTPVYQVRTLGADGKPVTEPPLLAPPTHEFLTQCIGFMNLAPMDWVLQPPPPRVKTLRRLSIGNAGFENGLAGWQVEGSDQPKAIEVSGSQGSCAGWLATNSQNSDNKCDAVVYRKVKVQPGKHYMLSASLFTRQEGQSDNWYARFDNSDLRARLVCDPAGGAEFSGHNSTQWFRTDGRWLRFAKVWQAQSDAITIGVGFSRTRDWEKVVAAADNVSLVEVEPVD